MMAALGEAGLPPLFEMLPLFLEIEERRFVYFNTGNRYDPIPNSLSHNLDIRWPISAFFYSKTLNNLMDTLRPLLDNIKNGRPIEWDGNNNVGLFTDDAVEMSRDIRSTLENLKESDNEFDVWDAGEWISNASPRDLGVRINMTDAEINEAARARLTKAHNENTVIKAGIDALASALFNKIAMQRFE